MYCVMYGWFDTCINVFMSWSLVLGLISYSSYMASFFYALRNGMFIVFLFIVLFIFDRYRCVVDRILSFSIFSEYRRRSRFRHYRIVFVIEKKI